MKSPDASFTEPQAWEDEHGNWFYNWPGAKQLEKFLGRILPSDDQLITAANANPDNFSKYTRTREWDNGKICGSISGFWSSNAAFGDYAYCIVIVKNKNAFAKKTTFFRAA
jgi:hypothetical protein